MKSWSDMRDADKYKNDYLRFFDEENQYILNQFNGKYSLCNIEGYKGIFQDLKYGNRKILMYRLYCNVHKLCFIVTRSTLKKALNYSRNCELCNSVGQSERAKLDYTEINSRLRNSEHRLIRQYHFIIDLPRRIAKNGVQVINLKCNRHNFEFSQNLIQLGKNCGCTKCEIIIKNETLEIKAKEDAIKRLEIVEKGHSKIIKCNGVYKQKGHYRILFVCHSQNHEFPYPFQYFKDHIHKFICPKCYPYLKDSIGQRVVKEKLRDIGIKWTQKYKIEKCEDNRTLEWDFFIPKYNLMIEFDGSLHFIQSKGRGGIKKLLDVIRKDKIKNDFALQENINLLRIPYWQLNKKETSNIKDILLSAIKFINENKKNLNISSDSEVLEFYNNHYNEYSEKYILPHSTVQNPH